MQLHEEYVNFYKLRVQKCWPYFTIHCNLIFSCTHMWKNFITSILIKTIPVSRWVIRQIFKEYLTRNNHFVKRDSFVCQSVTEWGLESRKWWLNTIKVPVSLLAINFLFNTPPIICMVGIALTVIYLKQDILIPSLPPVIMLTIGWFLQMLGSAYISLCGFQDK